MMDRRRLCGFVLGTLGVMAMSGCGQKGPLFLPEEKLEELKKKQKQKTGLYPSAAAVRNV
jgi:predicted small lipoprotein YifL